MVWSGLIAQTVPVGDYVSVWKILPVLVLILIWARLLTWIDKDAPVVLLPRDMINAGMLIGFVAAFALFLMLPGFLVAFGVFFLIMAIEMGASAADLKMTIHPHPTLSETLMESAEVFFGQSTHVYKPKRK